MPIEALEDLYHSGCLLVLLESRCSFTLYTPYLRKLKVSSAPSQGTYVSSLSGITTLSVSTDLFSNKLLLSHTESWLISSECHWLLCYLIGTVYFNDLFSYYNNFSCRDTFSVDYILDNISHLLDIQHEWLFVRFCPTLVPILWTRILSNEPCFS